MRAAVCDADAVAKLVGQNGGASTLWVSPSYIRDDAHEHANFGRMTSGARRQIHFAITSACAC